MAREVDWKKIWADVEVRPVLHVGAGRPYRAPLAKARSARTAYSFHG